LRLGFLPSEWIQGCPVLPRWGIAGSPENSILLAAFLKQPIILMGHHQDLKDGIELLDQLARFINGLGSVSWSNVSEISRRNWQSRMDGSVCRLKPLSRMIAFPVPEEATQLLIEGTGDGYPSAWVLSDQGLEVAKINSGEGLSLRQLLNRTVLIRALRNAVPPKRGTVIVPPLRAFCRRVLTEGRDRLLR
jgi:hypothetical protein